MALTVGTIIIVNTPRGDRPAIITRAWTQDNVNITLFLDGENDAALFTPDADNNRFCPDTGWMTSVHYDAKGELSRTFRLLSDVPAAAPAVAVPVAS